MSASALHALPLDRSRGRLLLQAVLLALTVVLACGLLPSGTASAAPVTVAQCNGTDNVGGQAVECDVTITNDFDVASGTGSSTVVVRECHGAANAAPLCTTTRQTFADVTNAVQQCNGSGSGGGGTVTCTVRVTNTITGAATTTPATVSQCNGSGTGGGTEPTTSCSPTGSTTSATVDQCNSSGNGGGATLRVRCTVDPSTQTAALPVTVNQCNGSGNGGGGFVTCRTAVTNTLRAAPTPAPSASPSTTVAPTASPSSSPTAAPSASATPTAVPSASASVTPSARPSATPATTPTTRPSAVPTAVAPSAPAAGGGPVVVVPVAGPLPAAPNGTGVLPAGEVPVTGGTTVVTVGTPVPSTVALPRTGADVGVLTLLGLLLAGSGGALVVLARRPARYVGRHALV